MPEQAKNGDTVSVHYTGRLESGEVFDSSAGSNPFEFKVGAGEVIVGFDEGVQGMQVGDRRTIEIEADDAYGQGVDALVQQVAREGLRLETEPSVGMNVILQLPDGNEIPVAVTEVTKDHVTLDANHPLAGRKLIFDIELIALQQEA